MDDAKKAAMARAEAAGAKYFKGWDAARIEAAAIEAEQAANQAPADSPDTHRAEVMRKAHEMGMDLEDLKGRPLDEVLGMIAKHSSETALARAQERREIVAEAAKLGFNVNEPDFERLTNEQILERITEAYGQRAKRLTQPAGGVVGRVKVRVLKKGHNKISKGVHVPGMGDLKYDHGAELTMARAAATQLEERGFVEVIDG